MKKLHLLQRKDTVTKKPRAGLTINSRPLVTPAEAHTSQFTMVWGQYAFPPLRLPCPRSSVWWNSTHPSRLTSGVTSPLQPCKMLPLPGKMNHLPLPAPTALLVLHCDSGSHTSQWCQKGGDCCSISFVSLTGPDKRPGTSKVSVRKIYWIVWQNYKQYFNSQWWEHYLMCITGIILIEQLNAGHYVGALHTMVFNPSHQSYEESRAQEEETRTLRSKLSLTAGHILHPCSTAWSRMPQATDTTSVSLEVLLYKTGMIMLKCSGPLSTRASGRPVKSHHLLKTGRQWRR